MSRNYRRRAGFRCTIGLLSLPVHPLAGQRVGYARISSAWQNLDGQTDVLTAAGCEKVFADTASGKLAERPELTQRLVIPSGRRHAGGRSAGPVGAGGVAPGGRR